MSRDGSAGAWTRGPRGLAALCAPRGRRRTAVPGVRLGRRRRCVRHAGAGSWRSARRGRRLSLRATLSTTTPSPAATATATAPAFARGAAFLSRLDGATRTGRLRPVLLTTVVLALLVRVVDGGSQGRLGRRGLCGLR